MYLRRRKRRVGVEAYETRDPAFFIADPPIRRPADPFPPESWAKLSWPLATLTIARNVG
jgi:hypothetical protein